MSIALQRSIVHLDADAFFASVEQSADARLRGKPVAVGGEKRGIIASASYEARQFGIYTPMPTVQARRLCPKLIIVPGDFEKYELFSRLMFSYAYDFTPDVEIGSIDEGYFDLTGVRKPPVDIAETIRRAIRQSLKLSVSEGIASNKLVSQIASKLKKPSAFQFVPPGNEAGFLSPLANKWLPGIGPKTAVQLNAAGLAHVGQIALTPTDLLSLLVGSLAPQLKNFALGLDERPVIPARAPAKSYGEQETFAADTTDELFLEATLRRMADKLMAKVRADSKSIRTLTVKVRYNDMDEEQAGQSLAEPTDVETEIYGNIATLLRKAWKRRVSLRLVSLKLSNVYDGRFRSGLALEAPARRHDAEQRLADIVDELRQKYGRSVLLRGHDFLLRLKQNRGEEPTSADNGKDEVSGQELKEAPQAYKLAVVQRQRLGHSSARAPAVGQAFQPAGARGFQPRVRAWAAGKPPSPADRNVCPTRRRSAQYIPLNVHSYFSFLDSTLSIHAIIALAQRHELPAIAITDTNNLHGAVEFAQAAAAAGIKPIIGAELQWHGQRLCLYVQNQTGYRNLCRILNKVGQASRLPVPGASQPQARAPGGWKPPSPAGWKPALQPDSTDGLLAVSPVTELAQYFPDRFYLEIDSLDAFTKRSSTLPRVASLPIHYEQPADRWKYDIVQSIRTLTLLRQQHPQKRLGGEYHFRPAIEMRQRFAAQPELLAHSRELADRCSFQFSLGKPQFPSYYPPDGSPPAAFLRRLVMQGLHRRYPKKHAQLKSQLETELAIITEVGYEEYFLVMWDILQECRRRGIEWITRGSAADSLACYCLEISSVCPIRFDLYFRRFLNKDRMALNKLPDIDVDFPHDRKDDVIDLIFEKYGPAKAAIVGGFSTFQSRSAFAEVAKVLGVSEFQVRRLTERLPHYSHASELAEAIAETQECRDLPLQEEPYRTALKMGCFLDGFPRYPKMHPCGLVLSRQPMDEIVPCFISAKGYPTTHFDMDSVEAVGLIKMDILAQGGLAVMRDVQEMLAAAQVGQASCLPVRVASSHPTGKLDTTKILENGNMVQIDQFRRNGARSPLNRQAGSLPYGLRLRLATVSVLQTVPISCPEGTSDNSPTFQRWERVPNATLVPKGRPNDSTVSAVPSGFTTFHHQLPNVETLGYCRSSLRDEHEILAASDRKPALPQNETCPVNTQPIDFAALEPWTNPDVWDLIASGQARAVHHIESPAMISLCKMCNVRDIDTLIAIVSVIRPGAANESKKMEFARRYQGLSPVHYPHPSLEACLRSTYGLVVYEEHILQICEAFAGLPPGRADILRRALAKERPDVIAQIEIEFAQCARRLGRTEAQITEVWNLVTGFKGYAFCKAHSTAYGVEAYQSAWLKLNYPAEFMAAVLTNGKGFYQPLVYVLECHRLGIPLLPPSVNEPGPQFTVNQGKIRVPVQQVKGLTQRTKERLLSELAQRAFGSLSDFFERVRPLNEEMEALIRVGAFDEFGQNRTAQYWEFRSRSTPTKSEGRRSKAERRPKAEGRNPKEDRTPKSESDDSTSSEKQNLAELPGTSCALSLRPSAFGLLSDFGLRPSDLHSRPSDLPRSPEQLWLFPAANLDRLPSVPLAEPDRQQRLRWEEELLGYPASGHPLELFSHIAWETYCPVNRLGEHVGEQIITCGLVIEQRLFHQTTGEPMKFITIADWTGVVETELFARTYKSYGLNTVRYRVLEITATVEPFENGRGFTLRVIRAGKPRTRGSG